MNRVMRLGTVTAAVVGGILAVAWIVKDRLTGPAPAPVASVPAPPVRVAAPPPTPARSGDDDLSEINGIGPVYKARLAEAGIADFAALAQADATTIADAIQAPVSRIQAWIDAARRLA